MDLNRELRSAIGTGNVRLGTSQCREAVAAGKAKLVLLAHNCPAAAVEEIEQGEVPVYRFDGTNADLGVACGKPFGISAVTVLDGGNSEILGLRTAL